MPSLKLSNPFRRSVDRPSLKERTASLKATAARVIGRKAPEQDADPFDGMRCPPGFVPYPFDKPESFVSIGHIAIPAEARRLLDLAQAEEARRLRFIADEVPEDLRAERHRHIRTLLRLDALAALADPAMADAAPALDVRSDTDAFLLDLGRQFETARLAEDEATNRFADAEAALHAALPEKPAGLVFRDGDHAFKLRRLHMHPDGFEGLPVTPSDIAWMMRQPIQHDVLRDVRDGERAWRDFPGKVMESQPWPEAQARADELIALYDGWQAECERVRTASGVDAADEEMKAAFQAAKALAVQIAAVPTRSAEGLKVKIRALSFYFSSPGDDEDPEAILARSLAHDAAATSPVSEEEEPVTLEGAAALSFDAYAFEGPPRSPAEWKEKLCSQIIGLALADRLLRMGKAEMEAFITNAESKEGGALPAVMFQTLGSTQEALAGLGEVLDTARARYMAAASSVALKASQAAES